MGDATASTGLAIEPPPATDAEIFRCHEAAYLATVKREIGAGRRRLSPGDMAVSEPSLDCDRLVSTLEHGEALDGLASAVASHVRALLGEG